MRLHALMAVLLAAGVVIGAAGAKSSASSAVDAWLVRDLGARVEIRTDGQIVGGVGLYYEFGILRGDFVVRPDPAINNEGMVAGTLKVGSHKRAFVWDRGKLTRLGVLPGDSDSSFVALNDRGQVVGVSGSLKDGIVRGRAFLWEKGRMRNLGAFVPSDINERGVVVGTATSRHPDAVLWRGGRLRHLGTLPGATDSRGVALNDAGQVVGWSPIGPPWSRVRGFVWQKGKMRSLGTLPLPWRTGSIAVDINERGQIVGELTGRAHGLVDEGWWGGVFIWQNGRMRTVTPRGELATAINDLGQVTHTRSGSGGWILWQDGSVRHQGYGEATALTERGRFVINHAHGYHEIPWIFANGQRSRLPVPDDEAAATALNDREQVVGLSCTRTDLPRGYFYRCHVVLWSPRP